MATIAKNYTKGPRKGKIRLIVIHSMESQEKPKTAAAVAKWFSNDNAPKSSAHYCVDDKQAVKVVEDSDIAWAAPGANSDGLHIEIAGSARQTRKQWLDEYSIGCLDQAAKVAAAWCVKYQIPVKRLNINQTVDGKTKGFIGHVDATKAFPHLGGDHTDPGKNFPWDVFLGKVAEAINNLPKGK